MADVTDAIARGREAFEQRAWRDAFESLSQGDSESALGAADLELLATAAYMLGRDDGYVAGLERAHQAHLEAGANLPAARCAVWAGLCLAVRGEWGRASGWFGRAERLIERDGGDCVERGYLLIPVIKQHEMRGDFEALYSTAAEAAQIAERHSDGDLQAMAVHEQGRALVKLARVADGLAPAGRGDGGRDRRRAVADRDRHDVLQRHRRLPDGARAEPVARVDRGAVAVV